MIKVDCIFCCEELEEPGGLIFSPPYYMDEFGEPVTEKWHVCVACFHNRIETA